MLSVVIPTLNEAGRLPACLSALIPAAIDGLVKEVIVSDGGSTDATAAIADDAGARFLAGPKGRGGQLARGAGAARGRWLLFLHADTVLEPGWESDARRLLIDEDKAGVFTLAFDGGRLAAKIVAAGAMLRTRIFASPYGDQGLLISRALYDRLGGFSDMPLFEDVDLVDRLVRHSGRRALRVFPSRAVTSPARYEKDGYMRRVAKNLACLAMYRAGVAPAKLAKLYQS